MNKEENKELNELEDLIYQYQWGNLTYLGEKKLVEKVNTIKKEKNNYKSRIDKAIEYINKHTIIQKSTGIKEYLGINHEDLLNILKGEEK